MVAAIDDIPTSEQLRAILHYLQIFEEAGFAQSDQVEATLSEFLSALYAEGFIGSFDWPAWQEEAWDYVEQPALLQQADLVTLRKLMTTHVRKDRFCNGHFDEMFECGQLTAILRRLKTLVNEA